MGTLNTATLNVLAKATYAPTVGATILDSTPSTPTINATPVYTTAPVLLFSGSRTLAATNETLDLTALTAPDGTALNFAKVKTIVINNTNVATGALLKVSPGASNGWIGTTSGNVGPFNATTDIQIIGAGGVWTQNSPVDGFGVSGTSKTIKVDAGANTIVYQIQIWGN